MKYGIIAGNGRFPVLALETARQLGDEAIAIAIREEASPEIEHLAARCHWVSLGELSKLIEICHTEGITEIMMAGQVKHAKIFSNIKPDWRLIKVLAALPFKNTSGLIGAVAKVLQSEGIHLVDSTKLLKPLLAEEGVLTKRKPTSEEQQNMNYGRKIADALSSFDLGQSCAVADKACVALEAMEGTDAMLRRAAELTNGAPLTLIKSSQRRGHLLFDVPVIGLETIRVMQQTNTTAASIDAGRTLLLDKAELLQAANKANITLIATRPETTRTSHQTSTVLQPATPPQNANLLQNPNLPNTQANYGAPAHGRETKVLLPNESGHPNSPKRPLP